MQEIMKVFEDPTRRNIILLSIKADNPSSIADVRKYALREYQKGIMEGWIAPPKENDLEAVEYIAAEYLKENPEIKV